MIIGSQAYIDAYDAHGAAWRKYKPIADAYRDRKIGDTAFLAARKEYDAATKLFDAAYAAEQAADRKIVAERKWQSGSKAPAPQQPCDVGLFSDDSKQKELF